MNFLFFLFHIAFAVPALTNHATRPPGTTLVGLDATDLSWFCPTATVKSIATQAVDLNPLATCSLLRMIDRGHIAFLQERASTSKATTTLNAATEYSWAKTAALGYLDKMGLDRNQVASVEARFINTRSSEQPEIERTLGIVVYVERQIAGIPSPAHRAVVIFDIDHKLRSIRTTWPKVPISSSRWDLPISGPCSIDGISIWVEQAVVSEEPVKLSSAFVPLSVTSAGTPVALSILSEGRIRGLDGQTLPQIRICGDNP